MFKYVPHIIKWKPYKSCKTQNLSFSLAAVLNVTSMSRLLIERSLGRIPTLTWNLSLVEKHSMACTNWVFLGFNVLFPCFF